MKLMYIYSYKDLRGLDYHKKKNRGPCFFICIRTRPVTTSDIRYIVRLLLYQMLPTKMTRNSIIVLVSFFSNINSRLINCVSPLFVLLLCNVYETVKTHEKFGNFSTWPNLNTKIGLHTLNKLVDYFPAS